MTQGLLVSPPRPQHDTRPAISHIGLPGNLHGLCGARTIGLKAHNSQHRCPRCDHIWDQMSWWQRHTYRGQP